LAIITESFRDFRRAWRLYFSFGLIYLLFSSYIFVPVLGYIFNRALLFTDSNVLVNNEVFKIFINYKSAAGLVFFVIAIVFFLVFEQSILILIAHKQYFRREIHFSEVILITLKNFHKLIGFGLFYLVFAGIIVFPMVNFPFEPVILDAINIPGILLDNLFSSNMFKLIYFCVLILFAYWILRWIFVPHEIILGKQKTFSAVKSSMILTRKIKDLSLFKLAILNLFLFLIIPGSLIGVVFLLNYFNIKINYKLYQNILTITGFLTWIYSLAVFPLNIIFITRLFYKLCEKESCPVLKEPVSIKIKKFNRFEDKVKAGIKKHRIKSGLIIVLGLSVVYFTSLFFAQNILHIGRDVTIAVHRAGYEYAPENSLSSIALALEQGAEMIEVDIQLTKDNVIVLHHDRTLMKLAGVPYRVEDLTYNQISQYEIGRNLYPEIEGEKIPTLEDALNLIDKRAKVLLDVKVYKDREIFAENIIEAVRNTNMLEHTYIQSFDYGILEIIRSLDSSIPVGQIMYYAIGNLSALDVDFYAINKSMLNRDLIQSARNDGRGVWVWTLNTEEDIKNALLYDIDGIITSKLELAQGILGVEIVIKTEDETEIYSEVNSFQYKTEITPFCELEIA